MAADSSHGQVIVAAGVATVANTRLGEFTVPAREGGWTMNHVMGQLVPITNTPAEAVNGFFGFTTPTGNFEPSPDPSRFLVAAQSSCLGAVADVPTCPLHRYDIENKIAGNALVGIAVELAIAAATAPIWAVGVHYAPDIVVPKRAFWCDRVRTTVTAAARTLVGRITLSERASEIVGIMGHLIQDGVLVTAEELIGFYDLVSDDVSLQPSEWLFNQAFGAGLGATINGGQIAPPMPHPVSIPVPGGAKIDCFVTLETAVTNGADAEIMILYR